MKNILKHNLLFYITTIFTAMLIVFLTVVVSKYNVIEHDDALGMFYEKYWTFLEKLFFNSYKGKWISSFFLKMSASVLPVTLGIHPVIWIQTGGAVIKGIFYVLFSFCCAKCLLLNKTKSVLLPCVSLITYLFVQIQLMGKYQNELYCSFFSFIFNFIFYFIFWQIFIKNYKQSSKVNYMLCFLALILGMSSELTACASLVALLILVLTDFFKYKHIDKFNLSLFISNIIGCFLYFINPGFFSDFVNKTNEGIFNSTKLQLMEVLRDIKVILTSEFMLYSIIIFILAYIIYKLFPKDRKKLYVLLSMFIGIIVFYLMLSITRDKNMGYLYIMHFDVLLNVKIAFLSIIFFETGILIKEKINLKITKLIFVMILLGFVIVYSLVNPKLHHDKEYYKERYLDERILAYYAYQNKIPVVYSKIGSYSIYSVYSRRIYNSEFNQEDIILKDNLTEVYKIYLKNGGCEITKTEINEADFQKLLNKNFVLYCNSSR